MGVSHTGQTLHPVSRGSLHPTQEVTNLLLLEGVMGLATEHPWVRAICATPTRCWLRHITGGSLTVRSEPYPKAELLPGQVSTRGRAGPSAPASELSFAGSGWGRHARSCLDLGPESPERICSHVGLLDLTNPVEDRQRRVFDRANLHGLEEQSEGESHPPRLGKGLDSQGPGCLPRDGYGPYHPRPFNQHIRSLVQLYGFRTPGIRPQVVSQILRIG